MVTVARSALCQRLCGASPQVIALLDQPVLQLVAGQRPACGLVVPGHDIGRKLGGAFGEGIDLPGTRLIGAFIATLGLPQVNPVNEQIRQRMQACLGRGYDYTYLFPGIQKVVQAAGRVIRTPQDRGVVFLMDDRFARAEVQNLLPGWWQAGGS